MKPIKLPELDSFEINVEVNGEVKYIMIVKIITDLLLKVNIIEIENF